MDVEAIGSGFLNKNLRVRAARLLETSGVVKRIFRAYVLSTSICVAVAVPCVCRVGVRGRVSACQAKRLGKHVQLRFLGDRSQTLVRLISPRSQRSVRRVCRSSICFETGGRSVTSPAVNHRARSGHVLQACIITQPGPSREGARV